MRTLHVGLRVSDLGRSLAFYTAIGYTVVGTVEGTAFGSLTMLRLPGDSFVTIELVHDPARGPADLGTGINHLVVQVESLDATLAGLPRRGSRPSHPHRPPARTGRGPAGSPTPGRLPDRAGRVAGRPCRRQHRGRLRLSRRMHGSGTGRRRTASYFHVRPSGRCTQFWDDCRRAACPSAALAVTECNQASRN